MTRKNMVTIPASMMQKFGLSEGSRLKFVEIDEGLLLIPVKTLKDPARP